MELASITVTNDIKIRLAATNTTVAGAVKTIDVQQASEPVAKVSETSDIITGLTNGVVQELDLDRDGTFDMRATADSNMKVSR